MARTVGSYGPKTLEAIRKAGLRLIFEHGYAAMSLRDLAAEVGIQVGSLYNHISTKQVLLFDLVQDHVNELLRQLDRALEDKKGPEQRLRAFVAFHVTYHMSLVGPGLAAPEREIVGIGDLTLRGILRLDHLVGNALALAIGHRVFLGIETQRELLLHVAGRGPAHQGLDRPGLLGLVIELP